MEVFIQNSNQINAKIQVLVNTGQQIVLLNMINSTPPNVANRSLTGIRNENTREEVYNRISLRAEPTQNEQSNLANENVTPQLGNILKHRKHMDYKSKIRMNLKRQLRPTKN